MANQSDRQNLNGQNGDNTNVVTAPRGQPMSNQDFLGGMRTNINNPSIQVSSIATNHQSVLSSPKGGASTQLESPTTQTVIDISTLIEDNIHATKTIFANRLEQLRKDEHQFGQRYRDRLNKIVIPDDFEEEVQETALESSCSDQATSVLRAAVDRQVRMEKIKKETVVLSQLVKDFEEVVALREEALQEIKELAEQNKNEADTLNVQLNKSIKVIRSTHRMKRWCVGIGVLVILILALVLGLYFGLNKHK